MLFTIGRRQYDYQPNAGMLRKINGLAAAKQRKRAVSAQHAGFWTRVVAQTPGSIYTRGPSCSVALIVALA